MIMDRRVKERLVGASILAALIVLVVPEFLSGPVPAPTAPKQPALQPEPVRNITVDLSTSKAPEPDPLVAAASSAPPAETRSAAAASAAGTPPATPSARLETAPPAPTTPTTAAKPVTSAGAWAVQLGSFASRANADKLMRQLKSQGFAVYVAPGGSGASVRYRVRVGPLADRTAAAQAVAKLKSLGHTASFVPPAP
jgi:DedD protein